MMTLSDLTNTKSIGICTHNDISNEMPIVLALGMFDGIHQGHRQILAKTVELAARHNAAPTMMTFSDHPLAFIKGKTVPPLLTTTREKAMLAADCGITQLLLTAFDEETAQTTADSFIENYILSLPVKAVVCGYNYTFGKDKKGNGEYLRQKLLPHGVEVVIFDNYTIEDKSVSSTLIRSLISSGDVAAANKYLGYEYIVGSTVSHGFNRGTKLGFPTANLIPDESKCIPSDGVYATIAYVEGKSYPSVTNIGKNPTYDNPTRTLETFLFDFSENIYDQYVTVVFVKKIRDEIRFSSTKDLSERIKADAATARQIVKDYVNEKHI